MARTIFFDMDGTIADLYGVENWLDFLIASDSLPYEIAKPLIRLSSLARILHRLQDEGYRVGIISWLSKNSTPDYDAKVTEAKKNWLKTHLPSVEFDEINIVPYGTAKEKFAKTEKDILFDDEEKNRQNWTGEAFGVENILEILRGLN
jgi:phosphoglycolate phosphatase-like HAD superfamily hydrolase